MATFKPSRAAGLPKKGQPLGLTKDQYEVIQKPTSRTTPEVTDVIEAPAGKLPQGYIWVWNRLDRIVERLLDNRPQIWEPYEFKVYQEDIARWLVAHSEIVGGVGHEHNIGGISALALEGGPGWLKPLGDYRPAEFINRAADPNPLGWGTDGIKTSQKLMNIGADPNPDPRR